MNTFIKGMDLSTLPEVERCGGKFYDNGKPGDAVSILKSYGMNLVRLRLWNDPYSEDGVPYGAGTNDLPRTVAMAKRLKSRRGRLDAGSPLQRFLGRPRQADHSQKLAGNGAEGAGRSRL